MRTPSETDLFVSELTIQAHLESKFWRAQLRYCVSKIQFLQNSSSLSPAAHPAGHRPGSMRTCVRMGAGLAAERVREETGLQRLVHRQCS